MELLENAKTRQMKTDVEILVGVKCSEIKSVTYEDIKIIAVQVKLKNPVKFLIYMYINIYMYTCMYVSYISFFLCEMFYTKTSL